MSFAATVVEKQEALNVLMAEYPQLKLKNEILGWDSYTRTRANRAQQEVLKGEHKFLFLTEVKKRIKEQGAPLTVEQLRGITTDYYIDLDDVEFIPWSYHFGDDGVPILCLESLVSAQ